CLELMATDAIVAIQDMGAAGLTSSSFEMASKGGLGIEMDLDRVPMRETGMTAYEIMLSESQERMLMVLKPGREDVARAVFEKWELDFAIVGHLTASGRMVLKRLGQVVADLPIDPLAKASPEYDRPWVMPKKAQPLDPLEVPALPALKALRTLLASPDLCSKRWIWEQYDHMVMGDTVARPGGDAALVRLHGSNRALALTCDVTPRYCQADPYEGGKQAVAEAWRNLSAVGAKPMAVTDNLNFGNPEKPEIMGQIVEAIRGMGEACKALDFPVVSGNVSLYNETNGKAILPTPAIGAVGLLEDLERRAGIAFEAAGLSILLVGETKGWLGASLYLREVVGREEGAPPPVDLALEKKNGEFVRKMIAANRVAACHDVADGGLLVAVAEMAMAGGIGATLLPSREVLLHAWAFGEDQGRYLIAASKANARAILTEADRANVKVETIGETGGDVLALSGGQAVSLIDLVAIHESWLPNFMAAPDRNA
ncbi:MAG: phosphoribosylformylglycinamidine synthase subunit PurL, partial [Rhodospirillales bacterium]|nr:phosphoribosylformylglycinamidine synthase subunit PurL [Rhodospirillales bacterium]